jgi:flagellar motor switch protein FliN/FliY
MSDEIQDQIQQEDGLNEAAMAAPQEPQAPAAPEKSKKKDEDNPMEFLSDVPMNISAELGQTELTIKDLLQLTVSSVIELNKLAGEPLEFLINDRTVARGEVIVVNDKYGIRLTDIVGNDEGEKVDQADMIS